MPQRQIFVIQSGWVLMGIPVSETPESITVQDCVCLRRWGATKGLGQIALQGPRKETVLDPIGIAYPQKNMLLFRIDCDEENWKKKLDGVMSLL